MWFDTKVDDFDSTSTHTRKFKNEIETNIYAFAVGRPY